MSSLGIQTLTKSIERAFVRAVALMIIVVSIAVVGSHVIVSILIGPYESATNRIRLAAQQATSAQEIVRLTTRLANEKNPGALYKLRADLSAEVDFFSNTHTKLAEGDPEGNIRRRMSAVSRDLFFHTTKGLDRWAKDIEAAARRDFLSDNLGGDLGAARDLEDMVQTAYSPRLSQLIDQYARDNWLSLRFVNLVRVGFLGLFYLSLAIAATMIFRPLSRKIVRRVRNFWVDDKADNANFDTATGLPNQIALVEFIETHCDLNWTHGLRQAVLRIDVQVPEVALDQEKEGLNAPSARIIARRMRTVCRQGDFVARLTPSQFAITAIGLDNREAVEALSNRLITQLSQTIEIDEENFKPKVRIGVSFVDKKNRQINEVLHQTNRALTSEKSTGTEDIRFFDKTGAGARKAAELQEDLRNAVTSGQISPLFQPFVQTKDGQLAGVDAAPAWQHPTMGVIDHVQLMKIADLAEVAKDVTLSSLDAALAALTAWDDDALDVPFISLHIRGKDLLDEGMLEAIEERLADSGFEPSRLRISLNEMALLDDAKGTLAEMVQDMSMRGFSFGMHAFGSGKITRYHTTRFRIASAILSRAFVSNIDSDGDQQLFVAEKITLSQECDFTLIVDGVQNQAEQAMLLRLECKSLAGPLICDPVTAEDLGLWLDQRSRLMA